jgi:hypothetical protein
MADTPMIDAPAPIEPETEAQSQQDSAPTAPVDQNPESQPQQQPDPAAPSAPADSLAEPPSAVVPEPSSPEAIPPPPDPRAEPPPDWVLFDEDLSKPSPEEEEELRLRESRGSELSALDVPSVEKRIFSDVDDPDTRPIKKLRLSWVIKGVRGTKEKPNHARVLVSPPALVDGSYWQIKFYPRGNKVSTYSAYIKCTKKPPSVKHAALESTFACFAGLPDDDIGQGAVPTQVVKTHPATQTNDQPSIDSGATSAASQQDPDPPVLEEAAPQEAEPRAEELVENLSDAAPEEDWRISAQIGVILYNPQEPRTHASISSEHQFSRHTDDWGWTSIANAGSWRDTHLRQHLQRAPLLQNDTLAIDAYIRIFDDPTQALWWRSSETEPHWDAKSLAGYFPMGTPPLYHSPAVAGMTAWLLLAPVREVLQSVDTGAWRKNSQIRPRPFIATLQTLLFLMRSQLKETPGENYIDLYPAIQALQFHGEEYTDVNTFWEVFRRAIELELGDEEAPAQKLRTIFDIPSGRLALPLLPVENVLDVQQSLSRVLQEKDFRGVLPNFLPLTLARDKFESRSREWKILHDRVIINDELDVAEFTDDAEHAKYTLYGFMVHAGARNSGKFYAVLRPNGPGTKWLAFEDGDGNQVHSLSRKGLTTFEGLEGQALKDFNSVRLTAYMAMYIKTSCLGDYLPGGLEPYRLPKWLAPHLLMSHRDGPEHFIDEPTSESPDQIRVEVYSDEGIVGREGLLDMYNIKVQSRHKGLFHIMQTPPKATFKALRQQLAQEMAIDNVESIRLFTMGPGGIGNYASAQIAGVILNDYVGNRRTPEQPLCLWMSVLKDKDQLELFGVPDPPVIDDVRLAEAPIEDAEESLAAATNTVVEEEAVPDAEQASIQAAVAGDVGRASRQDAPPTVANAEVVDPDTPMQMDESPPTAEESLTADVPHGHLVDAAVHEDMAAVVDQPENFNAPVPELTPAEEAVIAAVIAQDMEVMDVVLESGSESSDRTSHRSSDATSQSSSPPPEKAEGPVNHVYGFLQLFDVDRQEFRVHGTFFAKIEENLREFLRKHLGYSSDKNFAVWRRKSPVDGSIVGADETFQDPIFINGTDLVVYEPVSEDRIKQLEKEGKFTSPHELSKYLRAVERQHPILSKTSTEPVEIAGFGMDYYKGPLVNGRCHGAHCVSLNAAGNMYEGPLVCNIKCGKGGKMTYGNGDTYEGEWSQDERHGQGTFVEARTGNKYVGGFENGKRWGMGTTYWQVADEQADLCQICYGEEIDALFFDCGHVCACVECARQCELCPICRKQVKQVVKMFRS